MVHIGQHYGKSAQGMEEENLVFGSKLTGDIAHKLDSRAVWQWLHYSRILRLDDAACEGITRRLTLWRKRI